MLQAGLWRLALLSFLVEVKKGNAKLGSDLAHFFHSRLVNELAAWGPKCVDSVNRRVKTD